MFGADQQTIRVTVEQFITDVVRLGGGLSFFQTGAISEIRPHQQFRYARGGLDLRTRFEHRFFDGAEQVELRFRQRVQYTQPVAKDVKALGSAEWFGIIQPRREAGTTGTEQVRGVVGVAFQLNADLDISPSYMLQFTPRVDHPMRSAMSRR